MEIIRAKAKLIPGITPLLRRRGGRKKHKKCTWASVSAAPVIPKDRPQPEMATQPSMTTAVVRLVRWMAMAGWSPPPTLSAGPGGHHSEEDEGGHIPAPPSTRLQEPPAKP